MWAGDSQCTKSHKICLICFSRVHADQGMHRQYPVPISIGVFMSFFRGSTRWVCMTDDHDFVKKGRIRVILKRRVTF